jgi:hypothetical protein
VHGGPPPPKQKNKPDPVADACIDMTARSWPICRPGCGRVSRDPRGER